MSDDNKRPDTRPISPNAPGERSNLTSLETRRRLIDPGADSSPSSERKHSPDELASSIQASVSEIAVIWMLHRWSLTQNTESTPLDQQIRNFSPVAFDVIVSRFPALKTAKQEHLWLIYFKGLLTAGTHPREEMTKAIQIVGAQELIRAFPDAPAGEAVSTAPPTLTPDGDMHDADADALEQISRALGQSESQEP